MTKQKKIHEYSVHELLAIYQTREKHSYSELEWDYIELVIKDFRRIVNKMDDLKTGFNQLIKSYGAYGRKMIDEAIDTVNL